MRTHARNPAPRKIRSPADAARAAKSKGKAKGKGKSGEPALADVFAALRDIMAAHAASLDVKADKRGNYVVNSPKPDGKHDRLFGNVKTEKAFVSYHLFPIFMFPELADGISPELQKRMQGHSCFNFTRREPALFAELAELTERSFEEMRRRDLL